MWQLRSLLERKFDGLNALRFGAEAWYNKDHADINSAFFNGETDIEDTYGAAFVESDIYLSKIWPFVPA